MTTEPSELDKRIDEMLDKFRDETADLWDMFMKRDDPEPQKYDDLLDNGYAEARTAIKSIITEAENNLLEKIRLAGYDDMHGTYDYNRIAEEVFELWLQADTKDLL